MGDHGLSDLSAAPEEIDLTAEGLARIARTAEQFVDDNQLVGATTIVARRGKVAHFATCTDRKFDSRWGCVGPPGRRV